MSGRKAGSGADDLPPSRIAMLCAVADDGAGESRRGKDGWLGATCGFGQPLRIV